MVADDLIPGGRQTPYVGWRDPLVPLLRSRRGSFRQLENGRKSSNHAGLRQLASWQRCQLPTAGHSLQCLDLTGLPVGRGLPTAGSWQGNECSWQRRCQLPIGQGSWGLRKVQFVVIDPHIWVLDGHRGAGMRALVVGGEHRVLAHRQLAGGRVDIARWHA